MIRIIRTVLIAGVLGLGVLVTAAWTVPPLIDWSWARAPIADALTRATGHPVRLDGPIAIRLLPALALEAERLAIGPLGTIDRVDAALAIWPLLSGRIAIDRLVVEGPRLALAIDAAGRPSWAPHPDRTAAPAPVPPDAPDRDRAVGVPELTLGDVRLDGGQVRFADARTGQTISVEDLQLTAALPAADPALTVRGAATVNGGAVALALTAPAPARLVETGRGPAALALTTPHGETRFDGAVQVAPLPGLDGTFRLAVPSVAALARWLGRPLPDGRDPGGVEATARFGADGRSVTLADAVVSGDGVRVAAEGSLDLTGAAPRLALTMTSDPLDLDRFLPAPAPGSHPGTDPGPPAPAPAGGAPAGGLLTLLSDRPIPLDRLRTAAATIDLRLGGITGRGVTVGPTALRLDLADGRLVATLDQDQLVGGRVTARVTGDATGAVPTLSARLAVAGLDTAALTGAAARGPLSLELAVDSRGMSPRALAGALFGTASLAFDGRAGTVGPVTATLTLPETGAPVQLSATAMVADHPAELTATTAPMTRLVRATSAPLDLTLTTPTGNAHLDTELTLAPTVSLDGTITGRGEVPTPLALRAAVGATPTTLSLTDLSVSGDDVALTGDVRLDLAAAPPRLDATLAVTKAVLDRFFPAPPPAAGGPEAAGPTDLGGSAPPPWPTAPLPLDRLAAFDATVGVTLASATANGLAIGPGAATLKVTAARLDLSLEPLSVANGTVTGAVTADGAAVPPRVSGWLQVDGVAAGPVVAAATGAATLTGTTDGRADLEARGDSVRDLVGRLAGSGRLGFRDGTIQGINIPAMLRGLGRLGLDPGVAAGRRTDFASLGGSFHATDGVISSTDLDLKAPLVRVSGGARVALPPRTIDAEVIAKLVGTLTGQGGGDSLVGLPVPIRVTGPWHATAVTIDWSGVVEQAVRDPELLRLLPDELRTTVDGLGGGAERLLDALDRVIPPSGRPEGGGPSGVEGDGDAGPVPEEAVRILRGLFGR